MLLLLLLLLLMVYLIEIGLDVAVVGGHVGVEDGGDGGGHGGRHIHVTDVRHHDNKLREHHSSKEAQVRQLAQKSQTLLEAFATFGAKFKF